MRISHAILPVPSQLQMDSLIPILNKNFRGNLRGSSVPMDNTVAISKNGFIVSAINTNVIFTQPDGEITYTKALSDFFFLLNLGTRMYDPRVIYDQGKTNLYLCVCTVLIRQVRNYVLLFQKQKTQTGNGILQSKR